MTLTEILSYLRRMHNEEGAQSQNWSDQELLALITVRANEALSVIGLAETTDTSLVTVADQTAYNLPSGIIFVRRLYCDNRPLKYLNFRQQESRDPLGVAPSGTPREFTLWANQIQLMQAPSTAGQVIKIYGYSEQTMLSLMTDTLVVPSLFHGSLCHGVLADMWAKDLNNGMFDRYEAKWAQGKLDMMKYAARRKRFGLPVVTGDSDSLTETEFGVI